MWSCRMCEEVTCWTTHVCEDCRKIKNLMNIYGKPQIISVLDNVLVRNPLGIINKEEDLKKKGLVKVDSDGIAAKQITTRSKTSPKII